MSNSSMMATTAQVSASFDTLPHAPLPQATKNNIRCVTHQNTVEAVHIISVLSTIEQRELAECETIIAKGWNTFLEVGRALANIRDKRLYRAHYSTFEAYCRKKWEYGKSHVYRLIAAAQVVEQLSPIGDIPAPTTESQVRPLLGLSSEIAQAAWKNATAEAGGKAVTANVVKRAVAKLLGKSVHEVCSGLCQKSKIRSFHDQMATVVQLINQIELSIATGENPKTILKSLDEIKQKLISLERE